MPVASEMLAVRICVLESSLARGALESARLRRGGSCRWYNGGRRFFLHSLHRSRGLRFLFGDVLSLENLARAGGVLLAEGFYRLVALCVDDQFVAELVTLTLRLDLDALCLAERQNSVLSYA